MESSSATGSSSTSEFNKVQERLQRNETQQDVEFIEDIIEKINSENMSNINMSLELKNLMCDPSKIPEVTDCLRRFVNDNK
tara:strand:- start:733 stop:975 length:243 start_codon:yes stop_codon:yes gene_type:complete